MDSAPAPASPSVPRDLESLPDELLVELAKHLHGHDTGKRTSFRNLSLVSKCLLTTSNLACHSLSLSGLKASRLPRLLARFPDVTSLNLSFLFDCSEDTLATIGAHCPRLCHLHAPEAFKPSSPAVARLPSAGPPPPPPPLGHGLLSLCSGCPNLASLSLPSSQGPAAALLALGGARRLRVLNLKGAVNLDDSVLVEVASKCQELAELDLSFNSFTDAGLQALALGLPHLQKLDLRHCKRITGAGIACLAKGCLKIKHLHLGVVELNDAALVALGKHSAELEELYLDYGSSETGRVGQEAMGVLAQGCRRLRVLSLRGNKQVDDHALRGLARGCPSLQELDLHACAHVTDLGLHSLVLGCKKLRVLVLTGTNVGPGGRATFEGGLPLLSILRLNGEAITDPVLHSVAAACPALAELHLSACRVCDAGLQSILRTCTRLHTLVLKSCADIKATAFAGLCLPFLLNVQLPSCGITDPGLESLSAAAPALTSLTLASCPKLTADGIAAALPSFPALSSLVLTGCSQLSRHDVLLLTRSALPSLKSLRLSRPGSMDDEYTIKRLSVGWALPGWARASLGASASSKF